MAKMFTYNDVVKSVNEISNGETKLISTEYINTHTPLLFQCQCGDNFERTFGKFKNGNIKCKKCSYKILSEKNRLDFDYIIL